MTLAAGTRLGPYEVLSLLAGGVKPPDVDKSVDTNEDTVRSGTFEILLDQGPSGTGMNR